MLKPWEGQSASRCHFYSSLSTIYWAAKRSVCRTNGKKGQKKVDFRERSLAGGLRAAAIGWGDAGLLLLTMLLLSNPTSRVRALEIRKSLQIKRGIPRLCTKAAFGPFQSSPPLEINNSRIENSWIESRIREVGLDLGSNISGRRHALKSQI